MLANEAKTVPWVELLTEALMKPGMLSEGYRLFHNFSVGNQILAMLQLGGRVGPIATYRKWNEMGRQVKKGERAIALYVPVTIKADSAKGKGKGSRKERDEGESEKKSSSGGGRRIFLLRRYWFALAQTEGEDEPCISEPPGWERDRALAELGIDMEAFAHADGNAFGYSYRDRKCIAVSPLSPHPFKTMVHEMAHAIMHAEDGMEPSVHGPVPPQDVREVEAESVAYIVCATLGMELEALAYSRGYIQAWMEDESARAEFAQRRAARVFSAANKIIRAGQMASHEDQSLEEAA